MPILTTTPYQVPPPVMWDVSSATLDGFIQFPGVATPEDYWFSPNGDYMYVLDAFNNPIYHRTWRFPIAVPFDVLTRGAADQSWYLDPSVIAGDDKPDGLSLSPNGEHMYVSDKENPPQLHTWHLGTAFDLSTSVSAGLVIPRGFGTGSMASLYMSPDGTKIVELQGASTPFNLRAYTLSVPFSPANGIVQSSNVNINNLTIAFSMNLAGTQFVTLRSEGVGSTYIVDVFDIAVPWDLSSSVTFNSTVTLFPVSDNTIRRVWISPDGTRLYVMGAQNKYVYQYDL